MLNKYPVTMAPRIIATIKKAMYFFLNMPESIINSGGLIAVAVIRKAMTALALNPLRYEE